MHWQARGLSCDSNFLLLAGCCKQGRLNIAGVSGYVALIDLVERLNEFWFKLPTKSLGQATEAVGWRIHSAGFIAEKGASIGWG